MNQDQTLLATVVSLDPMYVYFDMDEVALLRIRRARQRGSDEAAAGSAIFPSRWVLQGEEGFPHEGVINFVDNQVNPGTGSISVRGRFDNPDHKDGVRLLSPGMFVRIRLPIGLPYKAALLVIDRGDHLRTKASNSSMSSTAKAKCNRDGSRPALQADGLRVVTESG